jgi:hypothetical protein
VVGVGLGEPAHGEVDEDEHVGPSQFADPSGGQLREGREVDPLQNDRLLELRCSQASLAGEALELVDLVLAQDLEEVEASEFLSPWTWSWRVSSERSGGVREPKSPCGPWRKAAAPPSPLASGSRSVSATRMP